MSLKKIVLAQVINLAENPRKFPGIFHRKIRWKCRQLFLGISHNPFRGTRSEEFLVTHSEEILITLSKEFLVTNSMEFLVTNSAEKPEKMSTSDKFFRTNSWEFPGNYSQDFLKSSSGISAYSWVNSLPRTQAK